MNNLYQANQYLHTNSDYAHSIRGIVAKPRTKGQLQQAIKTLEQKELGAYRKYFPDCNSYEDFRNRLKKIFSENPNDAKFIQLFTNENIKSYLNSIIGVQDKNSEINQNITISWNIIEQPVRLDLGLFNQGILSTKNNQLTLSLNGNIGKIKELFDKNLKKKFKSTSISEKALKRYLQSNEIENDLAAYLGMSNSAFSGRVQVGSVTAPSSKKFNQTYKSTGNRTLFSYTAQDIKDAETSKEIQEEIQEAATELKKRIEAQGQFNNCSIYLKNSFNNIWTGVINSKFIISSFAKGNTISTIVGSMGELQIALINDYLLRVLGEGKISQSLKAQLSDTLQQGEQAKADVTILRNIGIQVKNFNINAIGKDGKYYNINGNTHFRKLLNYPQFNEAISDRQELIGFLANYFFNDSFKAQRHSQLESLEQSLEFFFGEILNLALDNAVQDTVTFYYIGGKALVPGSIILREGLSKKIVSQIPKITSGFKDHKTDEKWEEERKKREDYWKKEDNFWVPGIKNSSGVLENLALDQTSVRVSFDYHAIGQGLEYFSIF